MEKLEKAKRMAMNRAWIVIICALIFLAFALAIRNSEVVRLDNRLIQDLDPLRTKPLIAFFSKLTDFGDSKLLILIMILSSLYLLLRKKFVALILLPAAFIVERCLNEALKNQIMRHRPNFPHLVDVSGYSFPSGHAMNASTVYGLLIILITPLIRIKWIKILWIGINLAMILLIGFSRPFLRVHFFTDVLAGYSLGGLVVGLALLAMIFIERRKKGNRGSW